MTIYKIGEIVYKKNKNIILESYGSGFWIQVANQERFEVNSKVKLYLADIFSDFTKSFSTYGFKDYMERVLFFDLINVNGIGAKIAMNILENGWQTVADLIVEGSVETLTKLNAVNEKIAKNLILTYQDKWLKIRGAANSKETSKNTINLNELGNSLKVLGFKEKQISYALSKIKVTDHLEDMVEQSIKIIATKYHENRPTT
ncbi:Holliday junction branch migration protein RuvA [Mycoplasmopsis alligatoris]|uniref:Holliday junction branch migration complex subunit RuvA n=1 Tax=Mycoplasmopsis alligatoris A21JP2 TaxID=747682 RepID=D4XW27_9BACT|nr:Holliday junction branch migration protein RuvA [Mycoplasmopsis alligatoris]EFF41439.1 putative Holliday junction DNA helicase RuvA [Mycoplasmopsis alligatoris A21JP2]